MITLSEQGRKTDRFPPLRIPGRGEHKSYCGAPITRYNVWCNAIRIAQEVATNMITVMAECSGCHQTFFYPRSSGGGRRRTWCDDCAPKHKRDATKQRVRRHRVSAAKQHELPAMTVHIMSCNGKTYCGSSKWGSVAKAVSEAIRQGRVRGRICKTCYRLFQADLGGVKR